MYQCVQYIAGAPVWLGGLLIYLEPCDVTVMALHPRKSGIYLGDLAWLYLPWEPYFATRKFFNGKM